MQSGNNNNNNGPNGQNPLPQQQQQQQYLPFFNPYVQGYPSFNPNLPQFGNPGFYGFSPSQFPFTPQQQSFSHMTTANSTVTCDNRGSNANDSDLTSNSPQPEAAAVSKAAPKDAAASAAAASAADVPKAAVSKAAPMDASKGVATRTRTAATDKGNNKVVDGSNKKKLKKKKENSVGKGKVDNREVEASKKTKENSVGKDNDDNREVKTSTASDQNEIKALEERLAELKNNMNSKNAAKKTAASKQARFSASLAGGASEGLEDPEGSDTEHTDEKKRKATSKSGGNPKRKKKGNGVSFVNGNRPSMIKGSKARNKVELFLTHYYQYNVVGTPTTHQIEAEGYAGMYSCILFKDNWDPSQNPKGKGGPNPSADPKTYYRKKEKIYAWSFHKKSRDELNQLFKDSAGVKFYTGYEGLLTIHREMFGFDWEEPKFHTADDIEDGYGSDSVENDGNVNGDAVDDDIDNASNASDDADIELETCDV